jgi:SOS-response transcriptional repressor LexA
MNMIAVPCVKLQLRAGVVGFETEPDMAFGGTISMPAVALQQQSAGWRQLLALRVRDQGMEPMLFEDDWVVINTGDTMLHSGDVYAVNWNGEACVQQLVKRGAEWYLTYVNPDFKPVNVRSGQLNIVGRVVYQPGRALTGKL